MSRFMLVAGMLVTLLGSVGSARAADIPCPVQQATWEVTTPLPDPWSSPVEVGKPVKRLSAYINGRDWIICRYANDDPYLSSVFEFVPGYGPFEYYKLTVVRPAFSNANYADINCPANAITTGLKTGIPSPWTSTTYVFHYAAKRLEESGTGKNIVCEYRTQDRDVWGAGPSAILRPVKPDTGPGLAGNSKPTPRPPNNITAAFGVTGVTLSTQSEIKAACPATVKFQGYITANGAGTVRYRVVHNGRPGSPKEMDFDRAEGRPVLFETEVGAGDRSGSVTARPKPAAPGSMTAAPAPDNRLSGWARIEILAPTSGVTRSDIASYAVWCVPSRPDRLKR